MYLMIDIETGGTNPGCAVFSIGAVIFDKVQTIDEFYLEIDHQSNKDLGLLFDPATMDWWTHRVIPSGTTSITTAITQCLSWATQHPITEIWANSPSFDLRILQHITKIANINWPYPYWIERDVRTLKSIAFPTYRLGNSHNALEDAKNQVRLVQQALEILSETRNPAQQPRNQWQLHQ